MADPLKDWPKDWLRLAQLDGPVAAGEVILEPPGGENDEWRYGELRYEPEGSGRSPLIATRPSMGVADIALTEIIEGKIQLIKKEAP